MNLSRREFLKAAAAVGIVGAEFSALKKTLAGPGDAPVIWLQGQGCTGCSVSFLNSVYYATVDELLLNTISVEYHNNIMASAGDMALSSASVARPSPIELAGLSEEWLATGTALNYDLNNDQKINNLDYALLARRGYVLVVEGAIPTGSAGLFCTVGDLPLIDALRTFASNAGTIIALGTCASYGGLSAGAPNPTSAKSVKDALTFLGISKPVVNIPGCPTHPDWLVGTISYLLVNGHAPTLDANGRPTDYFGQTVHSHCPNLSDYNARFANARHHATDNNGCLRSGCHANTDSAIPTPRILGGSGCLYALNCKGRITYSDCPSRKWNNPAKGAVGVNWCIESKAPCHGCTQPTFPDGMKPFFPLTGTGV